MAGSTREGAGTRSRRRARRALAASDASPSPMSVKLKVGPVNIAFQPQTEMYCNRLKATVRNQVVLEYWTEQETSG
ncbi:unnamed protein product [Urochloa humidicola]